METTMGSITHRKDGRFMGRFIIGYSDEGKALYQYVYGKTYDEAEEKVMIGREIEAQFLSRKRVLVKKVYAEWLDAVSNRVKQSTLANYKLKFEKHILPEFGEISCSRLTAGVINSFIRKKLDSGFSSSYVRDIIIVFKIMLKYAQDEYGLNISLKNITLPKCEKKPVEKISDAEQKQLVEYLKRNINLTSFGIMISLFMGLRIGELCGLRWSDIDLENKTLHINRSVQRIALADGCKKTGIVILPPKSSSSRRSISIPDRLVKYFERFKGDGSCYLLSGTERAVEPRTMQYRFKRILKLSLVSCHNYHILRHTFATNCIKNGFDIKTLSNVLGHSNINLTLNWYIHPDTAYERQLMNNGCLMV